MLGFTFNKEEAKRDGKRMLAVGRAVVRKNKETGEKIAQYVHCVAIGVKAIHIDKSN